MDYLNYLAVIAIIPFAFLAFKYWRQSKRYTREHFAFALLGYMATTSSGVVFLIVSQQTIVNFIAS
jgi:hypothetical protein